MQAATLVCEFLSLKVECCDCGRERWLTKDRLRRFRAVTINELGERLYCTGCRADGLPARNVSIEVASAQRPINSLRGIIR